MLVASLRDPLSDCKGPLFQIAFVSHAKIMTRTLTYRKHISIHAELIACKTLYTKTFAMRNFSTKNFSFEKPRLPLFASAELCDDKDFDTRLDI